MTTNDLYEATLYEKLEDGTVVCTACKLACKIRPDGIGVCGVRVNRGGKLYLLVYGQASAAHIDPIEKKPFYHFLPGTPVFSLGTVGCNFGCNFCQNWDLSQVTRDLRKELMKEKRLGDVDAEVGRYGYKLMPEQIVATCVDERIPTIAYTYNEPSIFFEYLYDTAVLAHEKGIRNVLVTNGYESEEALKMLGPRLTAMNVDLKSFSNTFYTKVCKAKLEPVLETIRFAKSLGIWLEITTLVIPGQNDSEAELTQIAEFIASVDTDIPWHLSAFHPDYKMRDTERTPVPTLWRAYQTGKAAGLKYVYLGNVQDSEHSTTRCPKCAHVLIRRMGFRAFIDPHFKNGYCRNCQSKIAGIWE
jgi:pyruvate formate lyase activating enzyme